MLANIFLDFSFLSYVLKFLCIYLLWKKSKLTILSSGYFQRKLFKV